MVALAVLVSPTINNTNHKNMTNIDHMDLIPAHVVMGLLHYTNRASFWEAVKKEGIPYYRITKRRILFCRRAVERWLKSRCSINTKGGSNL